MVSMLGGIIMRLASPQLFCNPKELK